MVTRLKTGRIEDRYPRPKFTREQIAEAIRACHGKPAVMARMLGCGLRTIHDYFGRDPTLLAEQDAARKEREDYHKELRELIPEIAEDKLLGLIRAADAKSPAAVFFALKTLWKDKGYSERVEQTGAGGGPITHALDLSKLTDQEYEVMRRLVQKATEGATEAPLVSKN